MLIWFLSLVDVRRETKGNVSCREYYCYKLQLRETERSVLLLCGRLLQQFVVDMYIKLETTRLEYFRKEQSNFRREVYQGIVDSVSSGECRGDRIGQRILLPSSFIGAKRSEKMVYMDAMNLVQQFGRSDLFKTMTCKLDWIDIQTELCPGQTPQYRPYLVTRVFRAKLNKIQKSKI